MNNPQLWRLLVLILIGISDITGVPVLSERITRTVTILYLIVGVVIVICVPFVLAYSYGYLAQFVVAFLVFLVALAGGELPGWIIVVFLWPIVLLLYLAAAGVEHVLGSRIRDWFVHGPRSDDHE